MYDIIVLNLIDCVEHFQRAIDVSLVAFRCSVLFLADQIMPYSALRRSDRTLLAQAEQMRIMYVRVLKKKI